MGHEKIGARETGNNCDSQGPHDQWVESTETGNSHPMAEV